MPKAILFDIDGTLVDSVDLHAEAWQAAFRHFGYERDVRAIREQIGKGGDQLMPEFIPPSELKTIVKELEQFRGELWKRDYMARVRPFAGVRALFQSLRERGFVLALASSAKQDEVQHYARLAQVEDLVQAFTSADEVDCSKPCPDVFQQALEKVGAAAEEAVVVGDSPYDAQAAVKIGLRTVGVLCGGFAVEKLRAAGCIQVYRDPQDLLAHVDEWTQQPNRRAA